MKILNELPTKYGIGVNKNKKCIDWKETVGEYIYVEHEVYGCVDFKVVRYYKRNNIPHIVLDYNGYVCKEGIFVGNFLNGQLGKVMNITNSSKNTFHLDENNILHIYGENKNGKWEALYSGEHTEKVMNSTWYVSECRIASNSFNFNGEQKYLHHVNIKPKSHMVIDHITNPHYLIDKFYDNRKENLRETTVVENSKNKSPKNGNYYTCLFKHGKGWRSSFEYDGASIRTKTKDDLNECVLDNLIAQRYLGYKHQEEEFYKLDELSDDRIKEVTSLLDNKINNNKNKKLIKKEYKYKIEVLDSCCYVHKNSKIMIIDNEYYLKNKLVIPLVRNGCVYWSVEYIYNNEKIRNLVHRDVIGLNANEYNEYKMCVDHLNNNTNDNRTVNLMITTSYSNNCNKKSKGYISSKNGGYQVKYMRNYRFWDLIGGVSQPNFKTEQEAINEVERRKIIIENARVKLKTKQELDELIKYCFDNNFLQENGLADLDLGYLYWNKILN